MKIDLYYWNWSHRHYDWFVFKKIGAKQICFRVRNQLKKSFLNQLGFMDIIDDKNEKKLVWM